MRLITKLTMICILFSGLEKLVTYVLMRVFPYETGEYNLLALQIWNVFGLEFGMVFVFVLSAMVIVGVRKTVDVCPKDVSAKIEKAATAVLIVVTIFYGCVLTWNLRIFMGMLFQWYVRLGANQHFSTVQ